MVSSAEHKVLKKARFSDQAGLQIRVYIEKLFSLFLISMSVFF